MGQRKGNVSKKAFVRSQCHTSGKRGILTPDMERERMGKREGKQNAMNWSDAFLLKVAMKEAVKAQRLIDVEAY